MSSLNSLLDTCQARQDTLLAQTRERVALWDNWLQAVPGVSGTGEDPGYDDDFQLMREEVNKLSGADTERICQLAEGLLTHCTGKASAAWLTDWNYWRACLNALAGNCIHSVTVAVKLHSNGWPVRV